MVKRAFHMGKYTKVFKHELHGTYASWKYWMLHIIGVGGSRSIKSKKELHLK